MSKINVIDRSGIRHEVDAEDGLKLMETLRELEYGVEAICGGMCSCATCHVYVAEEWLERLPEREPDEEELLEDLAFYEANSRLSCQLDMTPELEGLVVTLAPEE